MLPSGSSASYASVEVKEDEEIKKTIHKAKKLNLETMEVDLEKKDSIFNTLMIRVEPETKLVPDPLDGSGLILNQSQRSKKKRKVLCLKEEWTYREIAARFFSTISPLVLLAISITNRRKYLRRTEAKPNITPIFFQTLAIMCFYLRYFKDNQNEDDKDGEDRKC